jgi:hypothetical protein
MRNGHNLSLNKIIKNSKLINFSNLWKIFYFFNSKHSFFSGNFEKLENTPAEFKLKLMLYRYISCKLQKLQIKILTVCVITFSWALPQLDSILHRGKKVWTLQSIFDCVQPFFKKLPSMKIQRRNILEMKFSAIWFERSR